LQTVHLIVKLVSWLARIRISPSDSILAAAARLAPELVVVLVTARRVRLKVSDVRSWI